MKLSCLPVSLYPDLAAGRRSLDEWFRMAAALGLDGADVSVTHVASREPAYLHALRQEAAEAGLQVAMLATYSDFTHPDAAERARQIIGLDIKGTTVRKVLVAPAADIQREIYLGMILDRGARAITVIASAEGGVEIEELARTDPDKIVRLPLHPLIGLQDHQVRRLSFDLAVPAELRTEFTKVAWGLHQAFVETDADLAEINPLAITPDGELLALDAKIVLDESALFRHPDLEEMRDLDEEEPTEIAARDAGINFIKLDGDIGCMVNGAGLAMTTMDLVKLAGGEPANFLDIGGGASAEVMANGLEIILGDAQVKSVFVNVFGGITACDAVANGIVQAFELLDSRGETVTKPLVVRLDGNNADEGRRILDEAGNPLVERVDTMDGAARRAAELAAAGSKGA